MGECCNNKEDISLSCHCGANDSFKNSSFQPKCQNCSVKKKVRSEKEFKALLNRLSRIEGQRLPHRRGEDHPRLPPAGAPRHPHARPPLARRAARRA